MKGSRASVRSVVFIALCAVITLLYQVAAPSRLLAQGGDEEAEVNIPTPPPPPSGEDAEESPQSGTEIHVKDAEIGSIIKIFSKKTKRNYILDERVKGKVSIFLPSKVSDSEATRILDAILALKGFTIVPVGGNVYKVIPSKEARKTTIPTVTENGDEDPTATVVTRLVRLNYVGAEDLQNLLGQLVSQDGLITAYARSNSLVIIDYADNIKRITDIIDSIDVPSSDTDMTIVPIVHADASEVADTLKEILNDSKDDDDSSPSRAVDIIRNRLREAAAVRAEGQAGGDVGGSNVGFAATAKAAKIIPDLRTNAIILVANEAETSRLRAIISKLDSPVNLSSNRFYVYRCQHANAEELADVLGGLTGGGSSGGSSSSSGFGLSRTSSSDSDSGGLFGSSSSSSSRSRSQSRSQDRLASQRRNPGESRLSGNSGGATSVSFGEDVAITADPATNSLIIAASKTDYEKIIELLRELDIKRRQVLVEATILEVGIEDSVDLGVEFSSATGGADGGLLASNSLGSLTQLFTNPAALTNFTIAAASAGTIKLPGGATIPSQALLVKAAQASKNVNVLSAPNILTTDNEEAEIVVGNNVPFISSTSTTQENLNNTFNQVDRQDVGITLRITPQISSGDFVTLHIFTEVSDVVPGTANSTLGPTTTLRTSETTVITKSDQMIATGGLISDNVSDSSSGIPLLRDIPVLGQLFSVNGNTKRQTNLLIFITPKIIKDQFDSREATNTYRDSFEEKMETEDIKPERSKVLRNPALDNVAEATLVDGPKPGTIRASPQPPAPTLLSDVQGSEFDNETQKSGSGNKLSFKSSPPIPKLLAEQGTNEDVQENEPASTEMKASFDEQLDSGSAYVVLRGLSEVPQEFAATLPFPYSPGRPVGLIVPNDSTVASANFFAPGSRFGYRIANKIIEFDAVGVYHSSSDAEKFSKQERVAWRTMSPHEIINLGRGPWIRR